MDKPIVCICGGGSLGTVIAGFLSARGYKVNMLTSRPERWSKQIEVTDPNGKVFNGTLNAISADPEQVVPQSRIILFCLPGPAINDELIKIKPWVSRDAVVGSVFSCTGFFIMGVAVLGADAPLFGLQRVPFISRVKSYGQSGNLLGYRNMINVAFRGIADTAPLVAEFECMFATPVSVLAHPMEATLTNSNPILHPARLCCMFKDAELPFAEVPLFYEEWTDESSRLLMACDEEFQATLDAINLGGTVPRLVDYYDSTDAESLTRKLSSIQAFNGIKAPMKAVDGGYVPDYDNRYFLEDFPYGMMLIKLIAQSRGVATPSIDNVLRWFESVSGKHYLDGDKIADNDDTRSIACLNPEALNIVING